jgi:hypothetical protein
MQCHSTMDPMAATIRNAVHFPFYFAPQLVFNWYNRPPDRAPAALPTLEKDSEFWRRPPEGALKYRSYDGTLTSVSVLGVQQLGEELAKTNDLYVCAAKRYYKALTGISVDLSDSGAMTSPVLTKGELFHRNKVISLGNSLKASQQLRTLIKAIIESPTFIYPDKGV